MAKTLGNAKKLYVKASDTFVWLGGEQNSSLSLSAEFVETSDKSSEWRQGLAGKKSATVSGTLYIDASDAGQAAVLDALMNGDEVDWILGGYDTTKETGSFSGKGVITSISDTYNNGEVASRSIEIQVNGAVSVEA